MLFHEMGSTGEPDRKRRHFGSISSPNGPASAAKKQPFAPLSEDKKLDAAVLKFQNQKLVQKLEAQKAECVSLERKFSQLKEKQLPYDSTLAVVNKSWERVIADLESSSNHTVLYCGRGVKRRLSSGDSTSSSPEDVFLSRLLERGATESSCESSIPSQMQGDRVSIDQKTHNIIKNIISMIDGMWQLKDRVYAAAMQAQPGDSADGTRPCSSTQMISGDIEREVKNLRLAIGDIHLKHISLARELQSHRDTDAKNKAELKRLRGEFESTLVELEKSNSYLATLKAERDAAKGTFFPVLLGDKHVSRERGRDKQNDLHDMESALNDLVDQASSRQQELKRLLEERIDILKKLSSLQNNLKNFKCISSSQAYILVRDQISKAKEDLIQYQTLFKKLQVEKDNLSWREKEVNVKNEVTEFCNQSSSVTDYRLSELERQIQKQIDGRNLIDTRLEEASREPGRKDIIAQFKALVSSFPDDMGRMQSELSKHKEAASDINSLRADVQSLSITLDRKAKELEISSGRSADQVAETQKLRAMIQELQESETELKLILDMYGREATDSRDVFEARNSEYKAWAHVQSLNSSLDEQNLELRVKTAIEGEAISQQKLAAAEAEIAELRQKLENSKREKARLSDVLKSKHQENESYLSEIETIGQAYDDIQTQNQHLLQQITERDDYNIKLVLEGVRARQLRDTLLMDKQNVEREIHHTKTSIDFYELKAANVEDQLKSCSDQVRKLSEVRIQSAVSLEASQKKLRDVKRSSRQLRDLLEESQACLDNNRAGLALRQIELEKERFEKKRVEEELEIARRKASRLKSQLDGSSVVGKLQAELKEYKEILKCSICFDQPKEVVITKCYHLFCNPCVQLILDSRHRKCPTCAATFGANDVKPVYI